VTHLAAVPNLDPLIARHRDLNARHGALTGAELVRAMTDEFGQRIAVLSSFGTESAVLLHMVAEAAPHTPVLFLNTGKLFGETLRYRDTLINRFGLTNVQVVAPKLAAVAARDPKGTLWARDPDACCRLRKVEPMADALLPFDAWFTGRKSFQAHTRSGLPPIELVDERFRVNPLATWAPADLDAYFTRHDLPRHPLEADGFFSIGCMPCTSRVQPGEDRRAGRWRGRDKTECGIHLPMTAAHG
jgi:phosphoadenosine phosphosulfate reductase